MHGHASSARGCTGAYTLRRSAQLQCLPCGVPHVRAQHLERVDLLLGLGVRHEDHAAVALGVAQMRQAYACVARRPFDDGAPGRQEPALLGVPDQRGRGAVLDAPARVEELGFRDDVAAGLVAQFGEADQRRAAHRPQEALPHRVHPPGVGRPLAQAPGRRVQAPLHGCCFWLAWWTLSLHTHGYLDKPRQQLLASWPAHNPAVSCALVRSVLLTLLCS